MFDDIEDNLDQYVTKSGRVLTDEDIQKLADEAEVGYDVEHLKVPGLAESIVRFVTRNAFRESALLTPDPKYLVEAKDVLDHVRDVTGISEEQMGIWSNDEADKRDNT